MQRFLHEREASLAWLRTFADEQLDHERVHPRAGPMSGRRMLACWVAHDLLHLRQITKLLYDRLVADAPPGALDYAGRWR